MSRPTQGLVLRFPVRGCHPLRPAFPDASGTKITSHWPGPRSLATTRGVSRRLLSQTPVLMSFPPATEMFQFAGFASAPYVFRCGYPRGWVAPFGDPGINDRSHLPRAFRSVPRPSSPLSAKASTRCPYFALERHTQRQGPYPVEPQVPPSVEPEVPPEVLSSARQTLLSEDTFMRNQPTAPDPCRPGPAVVPRGHTTHFFTIVNQRHASTLRQSERRRQSRVSSCRVPGAAPVGAGGP